MEFMAGGPLNLALLHDGREIFSWYKRCEAAPLCIPRNVASDVHHFIMRSSSSKRAAAQNWVIVHCADGA